MFKTPWGIVYSRNLAEFVKEEIMEMCSKDVVNIRVPRKDHYNRLMGPPIIETEPLREEEEPPQIVKINKDEKKICEGKGRGRIRKAQSKSKGESEIGLKPVLPKNYSNKGTQNINFGPLRCKSTKCHNKCYTYKAKECFELHDKLRHSQQEREKVQELKERIY